MKPALLQLGLILLSGWLALPGRAQISTAVADVRMYGEVRALLTLGDGSLLVGGSVRYFNNTRITEMLRLDAAGTRLPWPVTVDGVVRTLTRDGGWVYLGGDFQVVNGASLPFAARVSEATGAVDPAWRPAPNGDVIDLAPAAGGILVSGAFTRMGGLPRSQLALVRTSGTGRAVENWRCDANGQVDSLEVQGGKIYVAGRFTRLNTTNIPYLARLTEATGAVEPAFNPSPSFHVFDLSIDATHLYVAGSFAQLGSGGASFAGRIVLTTGSVDTAWTPLPDTTATGICVSGNSVYLAGLWERVSNVPQRWIARIAKTGSAIDNTWRCPIDGGVLALEPDGNDGVWGGGRFSSGGTGAGLARFSNAQGTTPPAYAGRLEVPGEIKVIRAEPAGGWLCGGNFDTVNGTTRPGIFRLQANYQADPAWSAGLSGFFTQVNAMDLIPDAVGGAEMMIGGQFEINPAGTLLYNCLRLKTATGQVQTGFDPQPDAAVRSIVRQGALWVMGGDFRLAGVQSVPYLMRVDAGGLVDSGWRPQPDGPVSALLLHEGELYVGGDFTTFGLAPNFFPAPYLARLANLEPDAAWQPRPNGEVLTLATDGGRLFVGGRFTQMARAPRRYLAELPLGGAGTPAGWNPNPNGPVHALLLDNGYLHAGGGFSIIANFVWPRLARFQFGSLELDTAYRSTGEDGTVTALQTTPGNGLFAAGGFDGWDNDLAKRSFVRITPGPSGPAPSPLPPEEDGADEILAAYFPANGRPLQAAVVPAHDESGPRLSWEESSPLPPGMVARVQWSHDPVSWHESGGSADGLTRTIIIGAEGPRRTATVLTEPPTAAGPARPLFLRVVVTAGELPASPPSPVFPTP